MTSIISSGGRGVPNCSKQNSLSNLGLPYLQGDLYSPRHQVSRVQCHFELDTSRGQRFRAAILAGKLTSSMEPGGFALLPGDASVDSWFIEIPVLRTRRVYLATGSIFAKKIVLVLGRSESRLGIYRLCLHNFWHNSSKLA